MKRRIFIRNVAGLAALGFFQEFNLSRALAADRIVPKRIVIRTGWSMSGLGNRIYMPSAFKLIQRNIPVADLYFWPYTDDQVILDKIQSNTTRFNLLQGNLNDTGNDQSEKLIETLKKADMVFHFDGYVTEDSTGPSALASSKDLFDFCDKNNIPYVLHSLKLPADLNIDETSKGIINNAAVVIPSFTVDNKKLSASGIKNKNLNPDPDAAFYFDMIEDNKAMQYLRENNLDGKDFIVVSLRTHNHFQGPLDLDRHISKFLNVIQTWISQTGNPVLLIAGLDEDSGYLEKNLIDPMPPDSREKIILLKDVSDPSVINSILDKARLCMGNDPYFAMVAVGTRVPILFTRTSSADRFYESFSAISLDDRIIDLNVSEQDDVINMLFNLNKNYVESLVESDKAAKILGETEKKSFKPIDKKLGVEVNSKIREKRTGEERRRDNGRRSDFSHNGGGYRRGGYGGGEGGYNEYNH